MAPVSSQTVSKMFCSPPFRLGLLDFKEKSGLLLLLLLLPLFFSSPSSALVQLIFFTSPSSALLSSSSSDLLLQLSFFSSSSAHLLQISFFNSPQLIFFRSPSSALLLQLSSAHLLQLSFFSSSSAPLLWLLFRKSTISAAFLRKCRYFDGAPIPQTDHFGSFPAQISLLLWSSYSANRPFRQLSPSNLATFMELLFRGTISNDRNKVRVGIARSK